MKFKGNLSLRDVLSGHSKTDLLGMCQELGLGRVQRLTKPDLIKLMSQEIPSLTAAKMEYWDQPTYDLLKRMITDNPALSLGSEDCPQAAAYLLDELIGFPKEYFDSEYLLLPREVQNLFLAADGSAWQQIIKRNTEVARFSKGLLHYYGVLTAEELADFVNEFLEQPLAETYINKILSEIGFYTWNIAFENRLFLDLRLVDLEYVLKERGQNPDLNYRFLSKNQVWQAGEPGFQEETSAGRALEQFLAKEGLQKRSAEVLSVTFGVLQNGVEPAQAAQALAGYLGLGTKAQVRKFTELIINYSFSTASWSLKGHSPEDLLQGRISRQRPAPTDNVYDLATKKKIRGNTPCPCGSGRRFKECCGKPDLEH